MTLTVWWRVWSIRGRRFFYIDVGVKVELTPTIHANRNVTMKLVVEISSESGTYTIVDVAEPVISQENAKEVIHLKDGEVTVMADLLQKEKTRTVSGTPGLGEVPLMKYLFSTQQNETVDDELVFMLVPHVVRAPEVSRGTAVEIDTGASDAVRINRIAPTKDRKLSLARTRRKGEKLILSL